MFIEILPVRGLGFIPCLWSPLLDEVTVPVSFLVT